MGFAFEDETGLPAIVKRGAVETCAAAPSPHLSLHVEPEPTVTHPPIPEPYLSPAPAARFEPASLAAPAPSADVAPAAVPEPATDAQGSHPHATVERLPRNEAGLGEIMLRVQQFADRSADEARQQARAIIVDAHVEAASIVARARREADEMGAQPEPPIAPEAVAGLCSAIEEFADTNRVLVEELAQLRHTLIGSNGATPGSVSPGVAMVPPLAG